MIAEIHDNENSVDKTAGTVNENSGDSEWVS